MAPLRALLPALAAGLVVAMTATGAGTASVPSTGPPSTPEAAESAPDPTVAEVARLSRRHDCSPYGLPDGVEPVHAIVQGPDGGEVRLVPFAVGWETYVGDRPGTLLAVCAA